MDINGKFINDKFGKQQPFKVPEGYFENFAEQLMANLPEQKNASVVEMKSSSIKKLRPLAVAAASIAIAVSAITIYFHNHESQPATIAHSQQMKSVNTSSFDQMADYAMMDNEDVYAALIDQ